MSEHTHNIDYKTAFTVEPQEQSQVTITGELPYEEVAKEREAALKKLGENVELDGFRKGHVPADVLEKHIGESALLTEMAERALAHHYAHIVAAHELDVIGHPQVQITKLAKDNPFAFSLTVAVMPEVTLPDYKALAKGANEQKASTEVTDEDVDKQIEDIMRRKLAYDRLQAKAAASTDESDSKANETTDATELPTPESEAKKQAAEAEEAFDPETAPLPELTDDYVKELGQPGQFADVADFKAKIREHLELEKEREATAAHRGTITDQIIEATEIVVPQILIDSEMNQMFAQMEEDLKRNNLKMDDYLSHIKKTKEDLIKEWTPAAEKRAKLQLVLNEIAKAEDITPDEKELDEQVNQLMEQYQDADKARVQVYVASVMQNEAVMKMLEAQK